MMHLKIHEHLSKNINFRNDINKVKEKAYGSYELERKATFFVLKTFLNNQEIERDKREFLSV